MGIHNHFYRSACLVLTCMACAFSQNLFYIIRDNRPVVTKIVKPTNPYNATEADRAAKVLQQHIKDASNVEIPIVLESGAIVNEPAIYVEHTQAAQDAGLATDNLLADTYFMVVKNNKLFLVGRDWIPSTADNSLGAKGTFNAVFHFLRDYVGVIRAMPSDQGVYTPKKKDIATPDNLNRKITPTMLYVQNSIDNFNSGNGWWSLGNLARRATNDWSSGGHTWQPMFASLQGTTNPDSLDCFAQYGGVRSSTRGTSGWDATLCTSHPNFIPRVVAFMRDKFNQYEFVALGQNDGWHACECSRCAAKFGSVTPGASSGENAVRQVIQPHITVCESLYKSHPEKKVRFLVYGPTGYLYEIGKKSVPYPSWLPAKLPGNICAESCGPEIDVLQGLSDLGFQLTLYHYYYVTLGVGMGCKQSHWTIHKTVKKDIRYNIKGHYFCGGFNWPEEGPTYYVYMRTMHDSTLAPDTLLKEYCTALYGNAALSMFDFWRTFYAKVLVCTVGQGGEPGLNKIYGSVTDNFRLATKYADFWPLGNRVHMYWALQKAKTEAGSDTRAQNWIRLAETVAFEQVNTTSAASSAFLVYAANPAANAAKVPEISYWKKKRLNFESMVRSLPITWINSFFPQYESYFVVNDPLGRYIETKKPPFNDNTTFPPDDSKYSWSWPPDTFKVVYGPFSAIRQANEWKKEFESGAMPQLQIKGNGLQSGRISFTWIVPSQSRTELTIYNLQGQPVKVLASKQIMAEGSHAAYWDGSDTRGKFIADGIYFCSMQSGNYSLNKRLIFAR